MAEQSGAQYEAELRAANEYARNLSKELLEVEGISDRTRKKMSKMADAMKGQADIGDQLNTLIAERQKFIDEEVSNGRVISKTALARIDNEIRLLEKAKVNKDLQSDLKDTMYAQVGLSQDLVDKIKAGGIAALGLMVLAKVVKYLGDAVKRSIELTQQTGMSAGQAAQYEANIRKAQFSMDGMLLGFDKLNASAGELVNLTGNLNISPDTIKGTAALNELLGDQGAAARLQRSFETLSDDADGFRESIEDIATKQGVDARVAFEALSAEGGRLNSMTQEQVKLLAQEAILIKQMGADRQKAVDIASQGLDIESSLADQMKIQRLTGKDLTAEFEALRAATAASDVEGIARARADLAKKTADDAAGNLRIQTIINDALKMEDAERQNIITAAQKGNDLSKQAVDTENEKSEVLSRVVDFVKAYGIQIAVVAGILYGIKKFGGLKGALSGTGKGMGEGLMSMSAGLASLANPATLLGLGAVTVAIIGIGFALKLAAPGIKAFGDAMGSIIESLGTALSSVITSIGDVFVKVAQIATPQMALSLMGMAAGFVALSASLATFAVAGLAAIPAMIAVGTFASIGGAELLGGGNEDNSNEELVNEIKGLRSDIQSQPILISVDGKVVSEITKAQTRQKSFSRQMGR